MRKIIRIILVCLLGLAAFATAAATRFVTYTQFGAVGDSETCPCA